MHKQKELQHGFKTEICRVTWSYDIQSSVESRLGFGVTEKLNVESSFLLNKM